MHIKDLDVENRRSWQGALDMIFTPVSYTHLTLPTKLEV